MITGVTTEQTWIALSVLSKYPGLRCVLDVLQEREKQDARFGVSNHDPFTYLTILMEEVGELAQASLHERFGFAGKSTDMRAECVQVAAVALAMVECLDRKEWTWGTGECILPPCALDTEEKTYDD